MNSQIVKEQISQLIESIIEQTEIILNSKDKTPQIDIDIALSYVRELYKKFNELDKLNSKIAEQDSMFSSNRMNESKQVPVTEPLKKNIIAKEEVVKPLEMPVVHDISTPIVDEKPAIIEQLLIKEVKPDVQPALELFPETTVSQPKKQKEVKKSIFEKAAEGKQDNRIADKINSQPITSLKSAIGINEKFLFINELFSGNMHEYNSAMSKFDSLTSHEDALIYLQQLKANKNWADDQASYLKLHDLVERRFIS